MRHGRFVRDSDRFDWQDVRAMFGNGANDYLSQTGFPRPQSARGGSVS
jgi:hypothetical protein